MVDKLKLSKESQDKIKKIIDDSQKDPPRFDFRNASDDDRKEFMEKMQKQRKETMSSALKVLDDDQLVQWGEMTGKEFKGSLLGGPGGGFGFGGRRGQRGQGGPGGGGPNN